MYIRVFCLTLLILIGVSAGPGGASPHIRLVPEAGIRLDIQPVYTTGVPSNGFFPLRITVDNHSGRARTWFLTATQHAYRAGVGSSVFTQSLTVPDQSEQTFEVYVPIIYTSSQWQSRSIHIELTGYGIRTATLQSHASPHPTSSALPYIAMSEALHLRSWPVLTKAFEKQRKYLYGSKVLPDNMPRQWRGYAGVWRLLITAEEWDGLTAEVHRAVVDWVLMGGELHLFHRHQLPRGSRDYGGFRFEGIVTGNNVQKPLGLGHVALHIWDGQEIGPDYQTILQTDAQNPNRSVHYEHLDNAYTRQTWPFLDHMPTQRFSQGFLWVLGTFLLFYFILVGPFNVWRSAKRNQRLQLFFTTPIMAVVSSVILCVLLAMHAGFGAWGFRTTGVYLLPNQPKAMVMQEQITKTAFMFKTDFSAPQDLFITPIPLVKVPGKNNPVYHMAAEHLTGDWFANNAVQAQFAIALQPTRAGVDYVSSHTSKGLTLRSRMNTVLSDLFVRDANGQYWHGRHAVAGGEVTLRPVSRGAFLRWRRQTIDAQAGPKLRHALSRLDDRHGVFVALAEHAPDFAIETLPGINWKSQNTLIFGHLPSSTTTAHDGTLILQAAGHTP